MDEAPSRHGVLQLLAQLPDVDVHRAIGLAVGLAPDLAVELLARDDPVSPFHERRQQLEFAYREMERLAVHQDQELARADLELTGPKRRSLDGCLHVAERPSILRNIRYLSVEQL